VPLGGSSNPIVRILTTFVTFLFVAVWHDRTMQLLVRSSFVVCFFPQLFLTPPCLFLCSGGASWLRCFLHQKLLYYISPVFLLSNL
jgi:hypothetical protein